MSNPTTNAPGSNRFFSLLGLGRSTIDATNTQSRTEQAWAVKGTVVDVTGEAVSVFKPAAKIGRALPVISKVFAFADIGVNAYKLGTADKNSSPEQLGRMRRDIAYSVADFVFPVPMGTAMSMGEDMCKFANKNPQLMPKHTHVPNPFL